MKRPVTFLAAILLALLASDEVKAQWQAGNLALRTNGNSFQSGDRLKVELLALKIINEPFYTQVSYRFVEPVRIKDKDGHETTKHEERVRTRQAGPVLESLEEFRSLVLDDTFHFGEASPEGAYTIEVAVFSNYTKERVATLRSCIWYGDTKSSSKACPLYLRSLRWTYTDEWISFDGIFSERGRYSVVLMSADKVVKYFDAGVFTKGEKELSVTSDQLMRFAGQTFDVIVHDHAQNYSSTLVRVRIPTGSAN